MMYPKRLVNVKFYRFPSVAKEKEQREIWIRACRRGDGFICTKDSYVCSLHFVDKKGPTEEHTNPISATARRETYVKWKTGCFYKILYIILNILYLNNMRCAITKQTWCIIGESFEWKRKLPAIRNVLGEQFKTSQDELSATPAVGKRATKLTWRKRR